MSAVLQAPQPGFDNRKGLHPETRLCLAMVSAGLSALATLSPAARAAIVASLDDAVATGVVPPGEGADVIVRLRDHVNVEADPEAAQLRRLQEALIGSALRTAEAPIPRQVIEEPETDGQ